MWSCDCRWNRWMSRNRPILFQAFGSLGAPARVPPPAQGSFQVPSTYSNGAGANSGSTGNGLGSSSFGSGPKTSHYSGPPSPLFNSLTNAQSQILNATNNARNTVNRTADGINSSVELATARVDRIGQGVSQATAILSESVTVPIVPSETETPNFSSSSSGRIGDTDTSENAKWRTPVK